MFLVLLSAWQLFRSILHEIITTSCHLHETVLQWLHLVRATYLYCTIFTKAVEKRAGKLGRLHFGIILQTMPALLYTMTLTGQLMRC